MHKAYFKSLCAMLRDVQIAHTTDKMITRKVKARWSPFQKSLLASSDLDGM